MQAIWKTPEEIDKEIADRVVQLRKRKKISGKRLSEMSGVSYGSIKRFEQTGQISLISFTRLAVALDCTKELEELFTKVKYNSIEEVINEYD